MAWIRTIDEEHATGFLKTHYKKYGDPFEGVDNVLKAHSLNPMSLRHHYEFHKHLMTGKSGLSRMQREMISLLVSKMNRCSYSQKHHEKGLYLLTKNNFLVNAIKENFREADVPQKDIAMLEYVEKLTARPQSIKKSDVRALREAGFKDADILDIADVTAYCNFVNRIASGLGVELEDHMRNE
jgi:uncharacterized peroxidase-related enzyme